MTLKTSLFLLAVAALAIVAPAARADHGCGLCCGNMWGSPFGGYTSERIPYYALHPPVYYSHVVPRPYGYTPFAYPPGTMEPAMAPAPQTFINPFVPDNKAVEKKPVEQTAAAPKTYANPFLNGTGEVKLAKTAAR